MMNANSTAGFRLQSIITAEAYRFPGLFQLAYEQGTRPTIDFLADVLRRHTMAGAVKVDQPEVAATAFLAMVVGGLGRAFVWDLLWTRPTWRTASAFAFACFWTVFARADPLRSGTAPARTPADRLEHFRVRRIHLTVRKIRPNNGLERFTVSMKR